MVLGIDIGGTGCKAAIVDVNKGEYLTERIKFATPQPATPEAIKPILEQLILDLKFKGEEIGVGFPSIIKNRICCSATNLDNSWIGKDLFKYFSKATGKNCTVVNDADAAGLGELHFGNLKNTNGTVLLLTIGTGIGSALFIDGKLVPNTELGHLKYLSGKAEDFVSNKARKDGELSWETWGSELNRFLEHVDFLFSPDHIILGGGVSKKFELYEPYINANLSVGPAKLFNHAGIIGAALAGAKK